MVNTIGSIYSNMETNRLQSSVVGVSKEDFVGLTEILACAYLGKYKQTYLEYLKNSNKEGVFESYEEMLFLYLYKKKTGLSHDALSVTFGVAEYTVRYHCNQVEELLLSGLSAKKLVPKQGFSSVAEVVTFFETHKKVIIDVVEYGVNRPKDADNQKDRYSGKKKAYSKANDN